MSNIILCTNLVPLQTALAHKLIPTGYNIIKLNTIDEIFASVPTQGLVCLIDDNNLEKQKVLKMLTDIKKDEAKKITRIVLLTSISDTNLLKIFTQIGVDAILQSSLHIETIVDKFTTFLQKIESQHAQRKYIRLKPDKNDEAVLRLLNGNKYIAGEITDISMGGIAVKLPQNELDAIKEGTVYPNSQILIAKKTVVADIKMVKKGGDLVAFSFDKIRDSFRDSLAEYIYNKIQKDLGALQGNSQSAAQVQKLAEEQKSEPEEKKKEEETLNEQASESTQ